ncbi:MAG: 2-oxoacid:acceptor oxidoreductase family protein [Chloroflexi bacterium]|nr:2-oxoacid:acceptor oxidoreductase family protein [Chloroflexota bacterium]
MTGVASNLAPDLHEIRIHGRGGQGNVAAAELLAQAAFVAGKHVQAFPAFGAERMGAPVVAFVRLSDSPIRLRSQVYAPHVLIVQDRTLLTAGAASVAAGLPPGGLVLLNAPEVPDELFPALPAGARAVAVPATDIALETIGRAVPNTALLGAFAALTDAFSLAAVQQAVRERFPGALGEKNAEAAARGFAAARAAPERLVNSATPDHPSPRGRGVGGEVPSQAAIVLTTGVVAEGGSSAGPDGYKTGSWRVFRPVWDPAKCSGCNLCEVYCPDSAVFHRGPRDYATKLDYCKGCALCAEECPSGAITMVREDDARAAAGGGGTGGRDDGAAGGDGTTGRCGDGANPVPGAPSRADAPSRPRGEGGTR